MWYNNDHMETTNTQKPKVTARDFFLYLGFIAAFYTFLGVLINFAFAVINTIFPDRQFNYYDVYGTGMRFSVSMLIVVTPLFLFLLRRIYKHIVADPLKKEIWVRKFGLYLTLTLTIIMLAVDLVALINTFLGGEISTRFTLKALTVIVIGVLVWLFTKYELKDSFATKPKLARSFGWGVIVIVIGLIALGISYIGSPTTLRNIRDDNTREEHLSQIRYNVLNFYQTGEGKLPKTLEEMKIGNPYNDYSQNLVDPATKQPYEYKVLADKVVEGKKYPTFALCANFSEDGKADERVQGAGKGSIAPSIAYDSAMPFYPENTRFDDHPKGNHCFEISIDPLRYKPNPVPVLR